MHVKLLRNILNAGRSRKKIIESEANPKEPKLMDKLNEGLCILNTIDGTVPKSSYVVKSSYTTTLDI